MLCADADHFRSLLYQAEAERDELRKAVRDFLVVVGTTAPTPPAVDRLRDLVDR